jgi:hypothetical protein
MDEMPEKKANLRIHDNPAVVEIYANEFISSVFDGCVISLTFGSTRFVAEGTEDMPKEAQSPRVLVTNRLALSPSAAAEMLNAVSNILAAISRTPPAQGQPGGPERPN